MGDTTDDGRQSSGPRVPLRTSCELQLCSSCGVLFNAISQPQSREGIPSLLPSHLFLMPGGYWYNCCTDSNLNGVYYRMGEHKKHMDGISWYGWHGANYSLKRVEMKIRPEVFKPN